MKKIERNGLVRWVMEHGDVVEIQGEGDEDRVSIEWKNPGALGTSKPKHALVCVSGVRSLRVLPHCSNVVGIEGNDR